jgi:hypothetical protein
MNPWTAIAGAIVKFLTWLGTIFLIRKGAKDDARADAAEKSIEKAADANRAVVASQRERLRARYRRD